MILKTIYRIPLFRKVTSPVLEKWIEKKSNQFIDFIPKTSKVLDLGSGNCLVANHLMAKGYNIIPIDIKDLSIIKKIRPIIYNGRNIPFEANTYDCVLLLTVLHHTDDPEKLLSESKRVSKDIIIIEDTYKNLTQKLVTQFVDLIVNLGHSKMTYQNKTEKDWENIFKKYELEILSKRRRSILMFFQQTTYYLRKSDITKVCES